MKKMRVFSMLLAALFLLTAAVFAAPRQDFGTDATFVAAADNQKKNKKDNKGAAQNKQNAGATGNATPQSGVNATSLMDNAGLLTPTQKGEVLQALKTVEQKYGIRCAVVTMKTIGNDVPGKYANGLIDNVFNNGANGNIVMLLVMDKGDWYISTDKKLKDVVVGKEGVEYISKVAMKDIRKDYAGGFKRYAERTDELMAFYQEHKKGWTPDADNGGILAVIAGVVIGALGTFGVRSYLLGTMENVQRQAEADAYLDRDSFRLTGERDTYLYTDITRVEKSKGDDSDGSVSTSSADSDHGGGGGKF